MKIAKNRQGRRKSVFKVPGILGVLVLACSLILTSCAGASGGGGGGQSNNNSSNGPGNFDSGSTMAAIQKRGKLIVGLSLDNAPFADRNPNTGSIEGFDVEIAKQLAQAIFGDQIENKVQFVEITPANRETALENNQVDIVMGRYAISVDRKKYVDFAGPYYLSYQAVVSQNSYNGGPDFGSLLDLSGNKVCVVQGSTDVAALQQQAPGVDVSVVKNTIQECGVALKNGQVAAVAADYVDIQPLVSTQSTSLLTTYDPIPYGIGVHKGTTDLREWINDELDGDISKVWSSLYSQTVGQTGATSQQPPVDRY